MASTHLAAGRGTLLAETLNALDEDAEASALTTSEAGLWAGILQAVSPGASETALNTSGTGLMAAVLNALDPGANASALTMDPGGLLDGILYALDPAVEATPLTSSFDQLLALIAGAAEGGIGPTIQISSSSVAEDADIGDPIGTLSVVNGSGTYTFSITADPDSKFDIVVDELQVDGALDFETATSHQVTIEADNGVDAPISRVFTITVTDVSEAGDIALAFIFSSPAAQPWVFW